MVIKPKFTNTQWFSCKQFELTMSRRQKITDGPVPEHKIDGPVPEQKKTEAAAPVLQDQ